VSRHPKSGESLSFTHLLATIAHPTTCIATFTMASATASDLQTPSHPTPQGLSTSASTQFPTVNIGTRQSALAQIQARAVERALKDAYPDRTYKICPVLAQGDKDKITPLQQLSQGENAKSLWTGELESMLEAGEVDIIVHCLKGIFDLHAKYRLSC
jgi:hydroxymethylbilane synthase